MPDTPTSDSRTLFDPGPMPEEKLRMFAPVMCGDVQTALTYLENAMIRMASVVKQGERFTPFEERRVDSAIENIGEALEALTGIISEHRVLYSARDRSDSR